MRERKLNNFVVNVIDKNGKALTMVASYSNKEDFKKDLRSDGYKIKDVRAVNIHKYNDLSKKGKNQLRELEKEGITEVGKWYVH